MYTHYSVHAYVSTHCTHYTCVHIIVDGSDVAEIHVSIGEVATLTAPAITDAIRKLLQEDESD